MKNQRKGRISRAREAREVVMDFGGKEGFEL